MEFKRTSGILIPSSYKDEPFYSEIKQDLTRITKDYTGLNLITMKFYLENEKGLKIPRFFPLYKYVPEDYEIVDDIGTGKDIEIEHNITPRDDLQQSIMDYLMENDSGIIEAIPGAGKTVVSIYAIAQRKKKTFILVHRDSLAEQWKERIFQYTNLDKNKVKILNSKSFKEDLTVDILIGTNQMFASIAKRYNKEFLELLYESEFGIFIGDEVHTSVGAPTFARCSIHFPARVVFGLSATPYRNDGNGDVITYHLGDVFVPDGEATTMKAKATIILNSFGLVTSKTRRYIYWNGKLNRARYLNMLYKSESLVNISKALVYKFLKDGRDIVLTSDRIKFLDMMYDMIDFNDKSKFTRSASKDKLNNRMTFASTSKIRDGLDAPAKDCLIMTSPVGNIKQMAGRVCRTMDDKERPIVVDIVDIDEPEVRMSALRRIYFYKKSEWGIQYLLIEEGMKKRILNEEEALFLIKGEKNEKI